MKNDRTDESRVRDNSAANSRIDEERRLRERETEIRGSYRMMTPDPLFIPPEKIPEGWDYVWGRLSVKGEIDEARQLELASRGWTPVPASRHPEFAVLDVLKNNQDLKPYIHRNCTILYERPSVFGKEEKEKRIQDLAKQIGDMPGLDTMRNYNIGPVNVVNNDFYRANQY